MNKSHKQIVAFLDLLGFSHNYDIIERQKKDDSKKFASLAIGRLYRFYMDRLQMAITESCKEMKDFLDRNTEKTFDQEFLDSVLNPHILTISDSIVIAMDCDDDHVNLAYMFLTNFLLRLTDETMKSDHMFDELKKYGLSIFNPIRGGLAYDYAELNFHNQTPMIYGIAYNKAYKLEGAAGWPRIAVDPELSKILLSSEWNVNSLSETSEEGVSVYFDVLKFKYLQMIKKISNVDGQQQLIRDFATRHKKYIELNTRQASMLVKYDYVKREKLYPKYENWISYYNDRMKWLIQNDSNLSQVAASLVIKDDFLNSVFDDYETDLH